MARTRGSGVKVQNIPTDLYLQLFEIQYQFLYLGEKRLQRAVLERMDELWDTFDASEHKELAIQIQNLKK